MTQIGNYSSNNGADFYLSDEILSVIPTDPYDQLDLARKITSMAIASRVSGLESEATRMRHKIADKDRTIFDLQDKLSQLNQAFRDTEAQLQATLDENVKLMSERDALATATKKLSRDLLKLETFKRHLMQSLNDDNSPQAEAIDIGTCEQPVVSAVSLKDGIPNGYMASNLMSGSTEMGNRHQDATGYAGQRFSMTPYITSRHTSTNTPKVISTGGSPKFSAASSPKMTSGTMSPTKSQFEERSSLSSWYPSSQQSSAPSSPPHGRQFPARTPRIDGKEFFRQARSRLSYEQFAAFLINIKELNSHMQSREETLRKAEEIFGIENKDLYLAFQGLLNRSIR